MQTVEMPISKTMTVAIPQPCGCERAKAEQEQAAKASRAAEIERQRETNRIYLKRTGIPMGVFDSVPYGSIQTPSVDGFKEGRGYVFSGACGHGKTTLASHMAARYFLDGMQHIDSATILLERSVIFTTFVDLLNNLKNDFKGGSGQILERATGCDLLVIDDLGKEAPTDWALEQLWNILNARSNEHKPVIVTTQYGKVELYKRLAARGADAGMIDAVLSRLYAMCNEVKLNGENKRNKVTR